MTKTTYTVPSIPGSKRTSERPYTHAVVGQRNLAAARQRDADTSLNCDQSNWYYFLNILRVGIGGEWHHGFVVDQAVLDNARTHVSGHQTVDEYICAQIDKRIARTNKAGTGPLGVTEVLQWSMSEANARKAIGGYRWHCNVRVVECVDTGTKAAS